MPQVRQCRMCMKGISATANICPWCHTTTSYGKRRIATRTLRCQIEGDRTVVRTEEDGPERKTAPKSVAVTGPVKRTELTAV